jgi:hypothetical protein
VETRVGRSKEKFKVEPTFLGMAIASGLHAAKEYVYPGGFLRWIRSVFPHAALGVVGAIVINGAFFRASPGASYFRTTSQTCFQYVDRRFASY